MTGSNRRSTLVTVLAGALVLALFSTGGAVAGGLITSAQIKNNTIKSKDVRDNSLKGTDVRDGTLTGADIANSTLTGADIADGSLTNQDVGVLYASVESDGTLSASSGGVSPARISPGNYSVTFPRDIRSCAFSATVGSVNDGFDTGQVNVADLESAPKGVFVVTKDHTGVTATDKDFHLVVVC